MANIEIENSINSHDYSLSFSALQKAIYLKPEIYLVALARHYENGWGTNKDFSEAHRLYFYSAEMGNPDAKAWLNAHPQASVENIIANLTALEALPSGSIKIGKGAQDGAVNLYPARALDAEMEGEAILVCHISQNGKVDNCVVDEETPSNIGFGMATLKVISLYSIESDIEGLKPYAGKIFQFRYRWVLN
ncbi:energy transducer TonB [Asticcacaulis sp. SL142]|uniref:energy transducer TonB n=1 Tax=Asticcacaulis sp. SL142 TaxID=2995155 RepID=UPI00226C83F7|nr:energy transducer TonB [Asticcacaulis sp. SL142]WAC49214.1 energy transducer TonB [Asticcacaulis sp. SL142]